MQTLNWYLRRLLSMSPGEVLWRVSSEVRDRVDRLLVAGRQRGRELAVVASGNGAVGVPGFRVVDMALGQWAGAGDGAAERVWLDELLVKADAIVDGWFSFFDMVNVKLAAPADY